MLRRFADGGNPSYRVIDEARIVDMLLAGGWPYEIHYGDFSQAANEARAALDHCVAMGLPFAAATDGKRLFDSAEVMNFINWAGLHREIAIWERHFVATGRRMALDMYPAASADRDPAPLTTLPPRQFSVTLERDYDMRFCATRSPIRLRLPLPLEDTALTELKVTVTTLTGARDIECSQSTGRLDAILRGSVQDHATLGVRASFTAHPLPANGIGDTLSEADIELYTRPAEGFVQITPRIESLAEHVSGKGEEPDMRVERYWRYVIDTLVCSVVRYDQIPAAGPLDWVLDRGWCDCQLGCALLVALCRASGIPARMNSGYLLYRMSPRYHYWVEAWLPSRGWLPFDLLNWGLSRGGRDAQWRDYYFAGLDYRLRTQCLPRLFTGVSSVRLPPVWQLLTRPLVNGVEAGFWSPQSGGFVFVDRVTINEPA